MNETIQSIIKPRWLWILGRYEMKFNVGDLVYLKGQDVMMTVCYEFMAWDNESSEYAPKYHCEWFNTRNDIGSSDFGSDVLELVEKSNN